MNRKEFVRGFSLAEVMLSMILLGLILVISIMIVLPKHKEALNRMKIKKAVAVYEKVVNDISIENEIKSQPRFEAWIENEGNCLKIKDYYYRIVEQDPSNNCIFRTADGVWWDVTDLTFPMVAVNYKDLTTFNAESEEITVAFYFSGRFDDQGILRINDNAYENSLPDNAARINAEKKLWGYLLKKN